MTAAPDSEVALTVKRLLEMCSYGRRRPLDASARHSSAAREFIRPTTAAAGPLGIRGGSTQDDRARGHSDKEKFCNSLNCPQGCKMSEWPLSEQKNSATSKLNTRVRFPSPAPVI